MEDCRRMRAFILSLDMSGGIKVLCFHLYIHSFIHIFVHLTSIYSVPTMGQAILYSLGGEVRTKMKCCPQGLHSSERKPKINRYDYRQ